MTNYSEYMELIQKRRSMRAFTNQSISNENLKKIIDAARYAPSGMNFQPWEFIVVQDKDKISELVTMKPGELQIPFAAKIFMKKKLSNKKMPEKISIAKNASVLIVAVGDTRKKINLPGQKYTVKNNIIKLGKALPIVDVKSIWYSSMANSFMQMITAAASLGIYSQYCTFVASPLRKKKIHELLELPEYMEIYDAAAMGYPAYTPRPKYLRPLENVVHFENYDKHNSMTDLEILERAKDKSDMKYTQDDGSGQIY